MSKILFNIFHLPTLMLFRFLENKLPNFGWLLLWGIYGLVGFIVPSQPVYIFPICLSYMLVQLGTYYVPSINKHINNFFDGVNGN